MSRTLLALVLAVAALSGAPAHAAETEAPEAVSTSGGTVDLPPLIAPVLVNGRLRAYAFLSPQLKVETVAATWTVRERVPYLQDAFVRAVHAQPLHAEAPDAPVDARALRAALEAIAQAQFESGLVQSLDFKAVALGPAARR